MVYDRVSRLLLNYLGQGALLLTEGAKVTNPFYQLAQAVQLGYVLRRWTKKRARRSATEMGMMTGSPVLLHHLKHNRTLHKRVVLLSVVTEKRPEVDDEQRLSITELGQGFYRVVARFGFIETPQISRGLTLCRERGLAFDMMTTTFVLGRETLLLSGRSRMARWRKRLYAILARNAPSATSYFEIPPNRVVELGVQIEL